MKTVTPEEVKERITELRANVPVMKYTAADIADTLEYLLQFIEWKRVEHEKPCDTNQEVVVAYRDAYTTANLDGGRWHAVECSYPEGTFDWWLPLPPLPESAE